MSDLVKELTVIPLRGLEGHLLSATFSESCMKFAMTSDGGEAVATPSVCS